MKKLIVLSVLVFSFSFVSLSFSQPLPKEDSFINKFSINALFGKSYPVGSFSNDQKSANISGGAEVDYKLFESTYLIGNFYYHKFNLNLPFLAQPPDVYFDEAIQITLGAKQLFPVAENISFYGSTQGGYYSFRTISYFVMGTPHTDNFGINAGGGAVFEIDKRLSLRAGAVFHNVFGLDANFITLDGGFKVNL